MDSYVGPYRILRLINRGGQGSVYLGYDKRLHRRVAIKIYHLPSRRKARNELLHEARLVASMQSPKVVQVHDVIKSSAHLGLVMEYVPGCNLEELLRTVRPSLASVLTVGTDIAGALAAARHQHIVHGDLKAGNVLITETGRAKLTDFGIARNRGESPSRRWAAGSWSALSPEQYLGLPLDERSDLFALGVLLYRMLSGEQPFFKGDQLDRELLLRHSPRPLEEVASSQEVIPRELVAIIGELLHKDPAQRPASTLRVRQVLRAAARDIPMSASNSLLREARPCFRHESPEDIPPQVPAELGAAARSQVIRPGGRLARLWQALRASHWSTRAGTAVALIAITTVPVGIALHRRVALVQFEEPSISFSAPVDLPRGMSRQWLLGEVKAALGERLGELYVIGPVGAATATTLYSESAQLKLPSQAEQVFQTGLRCVEDLCVFAITRKQDGKIFNRQGVMFADMSLQQWQDIVRTTTRALYQ